MSLFEAVFKSSVKPVAVTVIENAVTAFDVIAPFAVVFIAIFIGVNATAVSQVVLVLTLIYIAVSKRENTFTLLYALIKASDGRRLNR